MENMITLYVRFDIDAVKKKFDTGVYGAACYKTVFRNLPANLLQGCHVSMGDSNATLSGREYVCIIGLSAPEKQLQSIREALSRNGEFSSVCAGNPLALASVETEPLVSDGVYTADGGLLDSWAKMAFDSLQEAPPEQTETPPPPLRPDTAEETRANAPKQRHGCLTTWLVIILIGNASAMIMGLLADHPIGIVLAFLGLINIGCVILLLTWNKIGFYGLALTSIIIFIINLYLGVNIIQAIAGFFGLFILWGLLNQTKNGVSGWENMKKIDWSSPADKLD
ncbi:MAG: hypothetical protein LBL07_03640 [Tannerella sp.]|jgi:hypothetical protein|nr:hypothetical protein [Tannerella sp.]